MVLLLFTVLEIERRAYELGIALPLSNIPSR
jgi:hypothetical protein